MSLSLVRQGRKAKRVCIQLFVFAMGRTTRASQPGASPTKRKFLWSEDEGRQDLPTTDSLPRRMAMDNKQPMKWWINSLNHLRHLYRVESSAATASTDLPDTVASRLSLSYRLYGTSMSGGS